MDTFTQEHINKTMSLERVEYWYRQGVISQAQYEVYKDLWIKTSFRYCSH
jgi:hypothetical protein